MNNRRAACTDILRQELSRISDSERMGWLCDHLQLYLQRWLSFSALPHIGVDGIVETDFHFFLLAAVDLINESINSRSVKSTPHDEWIAFVRTVDSISAKSGKEVGSKMQQQFESARRQMFLEEKAEPEREEM